jgi:acetyl-CoA carboxylase biotin carboxyl carrier protein
MAIKAEGRSSVGRIPDLPHEMVPRMRFSIAEVRQLIALMNTTDLCEIVIERPADGLRLVLRHADPAVVPASSPATPLPAPAPATAIQPAAQAPDEPVVETITAPLVGTFHRALRAGQKPLVSVGDIVRAGQIVAGIESLHVMNEVEAGVTGAITKILVQPGQMVEFGQPLMELEPAPEN